MTITIPKCSDAKKIQEQLEPTLKSSTENSGKLTVATSTYGERNQLLKNHVQSSSVSAVNPYANKRNRGEQKNDREKSQKFIRPIDATEACLPSIGTDIGLYTTFSQAFSTIEQSDHFGREKDGLIHDSKISERDKQLRVEQKTFDSQEMNSSYVASAIRDNHAALQPHVLHVSNRQRGNGILRFIRNVPFDYSDMVPDFIMSPNRCALFLSFKYHCLHPNYVHRRISELRTDFDLRVLLCLVDVEDNTSILFVLNKLCVVNNMTLILSWSEEEAARYLETFKAFEGKDASLIQKREHTNFADQVTDALICVRSVNKTDSAQLLSQFGNLKAIVTAPIDQLGLVPGLGPKKVKRLYDAFHKPFSNALARKRKEEQNIKMEEAKLEVNTAVESELSKCDEDIRVTEGGLEETYATNKSVVIETVNGEKTESMCVTIERCDAPTDVSVDKNFEAIVE